MPTTAGGSLPLFNPNTGVPPADAVELYLEAPRSLGVLYAAALSNQSGDGYMVAALERLQQKALDKAVQVIKRDGSCARVGEHARGAPGQPTVGKYLPATLYLTAVSERFADELTDVARLHEHVYVGGRALVADDEQDWPTDLVSLKRSLSAAQAEYQHALVKISEQALDLRWGYVRALDSTEVVEPPMYQHVAQLPHVMCSGSFALTQRWVSRDVMSPDESRHAV